jgi:type IV pilus assembly protein PilY1
MTTKRTIKKPLSIFCIVATLLFGRLSTADDIDIYATSGQSTVSPPQVMFSIDWRPNLSATVCQTGECQFLIEEGYLHAAPTDFFSLLRAVLKRVLASLSGVEVGIMLSHEQGSGKSCAGPQTGSSTCTNGGYILKGFTSVDDEAGMIDLFSRLDAIPLPQGNESHKYQGAELFFEFFRYLTGQGIYNGHNGWSDFGTNSMRNLDDPYDITPPASSAQLQWDTAIENGSDYISPIDIGANECSGGVYTINTLFQVSQQDDDSDDAISDPDDNDGGLIGINFKPPFRTGGRLSRVLEYLHDKDLSAITGSTIGNTSSKQNITSYFIVDPNHINNTTNAYAQAGGTGSALPLSDDPNELIKTIEDIFNQILSVSTTFVSAALPLNVFNRVDLVDDVYLAIFRADADGKPFWNGNLKKLKLIDRSGPILVDAGNNSAVNPLDGRINQTALTFWSNSSDISAPPDGETDYADGKDGRATNKGGGGGVIPGYRNVTGYTPGYLNPITGTTTESGPRRLYTEPSLFTDGINSTLMELNATIAIAENLLGTDTKLFKTVLPDTDCADQSVCTDFSNAVLADKTAATLKMKDFISFARGFEDSDNDGVFDDKRSWFMGDPLHSRPQPINYGGSSQTSDIRILMGSNDGFMHMFGADDGVEDWAFMPRSVMPILDRLLKNNAGISPVHPYSVDGSAVVLTNDNNNDGTLSAVDGDTVYAYFGLRRGGKHIYALNISDPDDPKLMWRIGADETEFTQLAQTWSQPQPIFIKLDDDNDSSTAPVGRWALIFGGGYNGDDDGDDMPDTGETTLGKDEFDGSDLTHTGSDDYEGNSIYIVDATTGALLWKATGPTNSSETVVTGGILGANAYRHADLKDSIAAEISATNGFPDVYHDRAYVGDTGGKMWRVDFYDDDPENWKLTLLASLGRHYSSDTTASDRRFYHSLDVVQAEDSLGEFSAIIGGSGTRPNPLATNTENYLYMIKDRNVSRIANNSALNHGDLQDLSNNCLQDNDASDCVGAILTDEDGDSGTPDVPIIPALEKGWKIKLDQCDGETTTGFCGEKSLSKPTTFLGKIFFTSYLPPASGAATNNCEPSEGAGLQYVISLQKGTAVKNFNFSNDTPSEIIYERFEKLASGGIPSEIIRAGIQGGQTIFISPDLSFEVDEDLSYLKTYWYQHLQQ